MEITGKKTNKKDRIGRFVPLWITPFVVVLTLLGGCATPPDLDNLSDQKIRKVSDRDLCEAYHYGRGENVRQELKRRKLIREAQWPSVDKNVVRQGMRECAVRAAWGAPNYTFASTDQDIDKTFVFRRNGRKIEVRIADGRVRSIERGDT